jgi:transcription termination/antitermination protein NusG
MDGMNYFVIQVRTTAEEKYMSLARTVLSGKDGRLIFPRKLMKERVRGGGYADQVKPVFPGYVFWECEELSNEIYWTLKRIDGFFRFLKNNHDIRPLSGDDREILIHFIGFGDVAEKSRVIFDENDRIIVLAGPLKGLEGFIVKVDKRKGRAKIRLTLCQEKFSIDLGFEAMERIVTGPSDGTTAKK